MQETMFEDQRVQRIFHDTTDSGVKAQMDNALRPGEQVIRRIHLKPSEAKSLARNNRKKMDKQSRKKNR